MQSTINDENNRNTDFFTCENVWLIMLNQPADDLVIRTAAVGTPMNSVSQIRFVSELFAKSANVIRRTISWFLLEGYYRKFHKPAKKH